MKCLLPLVFVIIAGVQASPESSEAPKSTTRQARGVAIPVLRSPEELGNLAVLRNNEVCGLRRNSVPDIFTRIVGGSPAERNEFPWQVSLQFVNNWYTHHICGATIIDQRWVLTAAHCTHNFQTHQLLAVAGEHHLTRRHANEQSRKVESIVEHANYDVDTQEYDIALIKLTQPLVLDGVTVAPICLPPYKAIFRGNGVVTGWGKTKEGGDSSDVLMKVVVPIISDRVCKNNYRTIGYTGPIHDNMICAGYSSGGRDACQGDSGGPFVCLGPDNRYYLTGVVSWGIGCAKPNVPGVYTEVSHFVPWINEVISERAKASPRPITMRFASFGEEHNENSGMTTTPQDTHDDTLNEEETRETNEMGIDNSGPFPHTHLPNQ